MNVWLFVGGALGMGGFGVWVMHRIDRFLAGGGLHPYWDEEEEHRARK